MASVRRERKELKVRHARGHHHKTSAKRRNHTEPHPHGHLAPFSRQPPIDLQQQQQQQQQQNQQEVFAIDVSERHPFDDYTFDDTSAGGYNGNTAPTAAGLSSSDGRIGMLNGEYADARWASGTDNVAVISFSRTGCYSGLEMAFVGIMAAVMSSALIMTAVICCKELRRSRKTRKLSCCEDLPLHSILRVDHVPLEPSGHHQPWMSYSRVSSPSSSPYRHCRDPADHHQQQQQQDNLQQQGHHHHLEEQQRDMSCSKMLSRCFHGLVPRDPLACCDAFGSSSSLADTDSCSGSSSLSIDSVGVGVGGGDGRLGVDSEDVIGGGSKSERFDGRWPVQKHVSKDAFLSFGGKIKSFSMEDLRSWDT